MTVDARRRIPATAAVRAAAGYPNVEFDLTEGVRARRGRTALAADEADLLDRATEIVADLSKHGVPPEVARCDSAVGGGGTPGVTLPSAAVRLPAGYGPALRTGTTPVVGRVEHGRCLLDLRTVHPHELPALSTAVLAAAPEGTGSCR